MTEKSNMAAADRGHVEIYDDSKNVDDWSFSDLDGNPSPGPAVAELNELFPSHHVVCGNKTIEVYHEKFGTLWAARFIGGGELPATLKGKWTSAEDAILEVKLYKARIESE